MTESKILTRADLPDSDKWDLFHLFANPDKWTEELNWIQKTYPKMTEWKGRLDESANALAGCLNFEKSLDQAIERVYHYASLQLSEDGANPEYLARMGQLQNLLTKVSEVWPFSALKFKLLLTTNSRSSSETRS